MKKLFLLALAAAASLAIAATTALADGGTPPPGWISSPPPGNISSSMGGASGLTVPSADSLKLPAVQVLNYGGCAVYVSWRHAGGLLQLNARPFGWCDSGNLANTLAWTFDVRPRRGYITSSYGFGLGVMTAPSAYRAHLSYRTVRGRHETCAVNLTSPKRAFVCR